MFESCRVCSLNNVAQWGCWEIAREIISNSTDADPLYILNFVNTHTFDVYTSTSPTYAECASIGESSKVYGGPTIGQFGEGLKVAAATAARLGGQIVVSTPDFRGRYSIRNEDGFRHPSLWLEIEDPNSRSAPLPSKGCIISVTVPSGNFQQYQSRFIPRASCLIPKTEPSKAVIYCKGVWIGELHYISRYDYNLDFELNRDRNVNSASSSIYTAAYSALSDLPKLPEDILTALFVDNDSVEFELQALTYAPWSSTRSDSPIGRQLREKAHSLYGPKVCIIDGEASPNQLEEATRQGYTAFATALPMTFFNFPRLSSIKPMPRTPPTNFTAPPPEVTRLKQRVDSFFSSRSIPSPSIICVTDDDHSRPLVWGHEGRYYYTVGRNDNPTETVFALLASHLATFTTSTQESKCGYPAELWSAAELFAALSRP